MNKFQPLVSIIIPVYNGANYLKEAIDSALAQTYPNIEILIINDGSNDNDATECIALSYGDKIRYISKQNGGVASALNVGITKMKGDYFSWLSHDDLYEKDKIQKQITALAELNYPKAVLYSNYSVFSTDPNKAILCQMKGVTPVDFRYWITVENCLHGCTLLIPRTAFTDCGLFNEKLRTTQDYDMWFRIAKKYDFIHMPLNLVKSRSHPEQGSLQMAGIVLNECNQLLLNFVKQLSMSELQVAAQCSPSLGYAKIASSMWYRGFSPVGRRAALLSIKHIASAPIKQMVLAQCVIAKGVLLHYIAPPVRKLIPPYLRLTIKKILYRLSSIAHSRLTNPPVEKKLSEMSLKQKFSAVYDENLFKGRLSRSGEGSDLVQTEIIRNELPKLIKEFNIQSMLDAPCGDWYWMKETKLNVPQYIGVDIVERLINKNQQEFASEQVSFQCLNLVSDKLPKVDLIFSRDCLVHLSYQDAINMLRNFKLSGAKYLLTTTFTDRKQNEDLGSGFWRTLNLQLAPFGFPAPLKLINEQCTEGDNQFTDKCLGLWRLEDLPCA